MSQESRENPAQQFVEKCHLKWFSTSKGFGFVVPDSGTYDVFLHASVLQRGGHPLIGKGAKLTCRLGKSNNGYFVQDILEIIDVGECPFAKDEDECTEGKATSVRGIVKWYDQSKEFGFVIPDDGVKDIFIHKTCLKKAGLEELITGQIVVVDYKPVIKGREAQSIRVIENP